MKNLEERVTEIEVAMKMFAEAVGDLQKTVASFGKRIRSIEKVIMEASQA